MAWTAPATATVGQTVTAAFWNQQVRDEFAYLHGDAGAVTLNDTILFGAPGGSGTMRGHRHPYSTDRHIESGSASSSTGGANNNTSAITFTDAYSAAPAVVTNDENLSNSIDVSATGRLTTGFTANFRNDSGGVQTVVMDWLSEGPDA